MEIETIEQIIKMLGDATGTAGTVAIIWVVGGLVASLINAGMVFYAFIYLVKSVIGYIKSPLTEAEAKLLRKNQENALLANKSLIEEKSRMVSNHCEALNQRNAAHDIELEKVKHLYKILKESQNDIPDARASADPTP